MDKQIHKKIEIKILSPVHIGSGRGNWTKADYLFDSAKKRVYILDLLKWMDFLAQYKKEEEYVRYLQRSIGAQGKGRSEKNTNTNKVDNLQFIKGFKPDFTPETCTFAQHSFAFQFYEAKSGNNSQRPAYDMSKKKSGKPINDIAPFIRDGNGNSFIPGSSLKGSLRTNHLRLVLDKDQQQREILERDLLCKERQCFPDLSKVDTNDKRLFNRYRKEVQGIISRFENNLLPKDKPFISISDAYADPNRGCKTDLYQDYDLFLGRDQESNPMPFVREYLLPGSTLYADLNLSTSFMKKMQTDYDITTPEEYLKSIGLETKRIFEDSESAAGTGNAIYKETLSIIGDPEGENPVFLLGGNTGFHQKTMLWPIFSDVEQGIDMTKKVLHKRDTNNRGKKDKMGSHWDDEVYSPRVLNTVKWKGQDVLAGLVSLRIMP